MLTLNADNAMFEYYYMFMFGNATYEWDGEASCCDYTRQTPIDFEVRLSPDTSMWQLSETEEETKLSTRDACNDYLDQVALILRKMDCGVSLQDLGFYAYA